MAKFYGAVGYYTETLEVRPGIYKEILVERNYCGDVLRSSRRLEPGDGVNDNVAINNLISIVADPYAYDHIFAIRYIRWMGVLWKVESCEVQDRRILLTIGGVYHGQANQAE